MNICRIARQPVGSALMVLLTLLLLCLTVPLPLSHTDHHTSTYCEKNINSALVVARLLRILLTEKGGYILSSQGILGRCNFPRLHKRICNQPHLQSLWEAEVSYTNFDVHSEREKNEISAGWSRNHNPLVTGKFV
jgi:hypothetical protein